MRYGEIWLRDHLVTAPDVHHRRALDGVSRREPLVSRLMGECLDDVKERGRGRVRRCSEVEEEGLEIEFVELGSGVVTVLLLCLRGRETATQQSSSKFGEHGGRGMVA